MCCLQWAPKRLNSCSAICCWSIYMQKGHIGVSKYIPTLFCGGSVAVPLPNGGWYSELVLGSDRKLLRSLLRRCDGINVFGRFHFLHSLVVVSSSVWLKGCRTVPEGTYWRFSWTLSLNGLQDAGPAIRKGWLASCYKRHCGVYVVWWNSSSLPRTLEDCSPCTGKNHCAKCRHH